MMNVVFNVFIILLSIITMQHLYGCSSNNGGESTTTTSGPATTTSPSTPFPTSSPGTPHPTGLYTFNGELGPSAPANMLIDFSQEPDIINRVNVTVASVQVPIQEVHYFINADNNQVKLRTEDIPPQYRAIMSSVTFEYFHSNESIRVTIPALGGPPIYLTRPSSTTTSTAAAAARRLST